MEKSEVEAFDLIIPYQNNWSHRLHIHISLFSEARICENFGASWVWTGEDEMVQIKLDYNLNIHVSEALIVQK